MLFCFNGKNIISSFTCLFTNILEFKISNVFKKQLVEKGHKFKSQTDTEVIVHLLTEYLKKNELNDAII